jgi:hypothetical protein
MEDLNDLIWSDAKGASGRRSAATTTSQHIHDDLLDLTSPTTTHAGSDLLDNLSSTQNDNVDDRPRPSVAAMRSLWENMSEKNMPAPNPLRSGTTSSPLKNTGATLLQPTRSSTPTTSRSVSPSVSFTGKNTSTGSTLSSDPFGDLLGLSGAPHLGKKSSNISAAGVRTLDDL